MSQITLERRNIPLGEPLTHFRTTESPLPAKSDSDQCCPHCHASLQNTERNTFQRIKLALFQLATSVLAILFSVIRLARLSIAIAFSLVGVIGFGLQNVGNRIVHPDDRRLLPRINAGANRPQTTSDRR